MRSRRKLLTVSLAAVLMAGTTAAWAGDPGKLDGFTAQSSAEQRAYEAGFKGAIKASVAEKLSTALSSHTQRVGTEGAKRSAQYSLRKLREWGLDAQLYSYSVYGPVPKSIEVTMTAPKRRELDVKESPYPWHEGFNTVVPGFNAYSPSGDVTGKVVYVNYGLPEDYAKLDELGIDTENKIVIARYGKSFRGVKAKVAEEHGAKGLILYSDPEDDGFVKGPVYPNGPWRPANAIQRGSIQYIFNYPGDPLTRGEPSIPGTARIDPSQAGNMPSIPTTPISYGQAKYLLQSLTGPQVPESWQGGLKFPYHVGPGATSARLNLDINYEQLPVNNVVAKIPGSEHPEQKVVIGAHYDGWTYGTADNTSGWVSTMLIARGLGAMLDKGWRPDRTIVIAGWDGEEYGLFGSTEWAEQFKKRLTEGAVAYLNMDGTGGKNFGTSSVPALDDLITSVTKSIKDPDHGTVYNNWDSQQEGPTEPERLGSGSDYTAFLDHIGIASADIGFSTPGGEYHSAYDDLYAMRNFLDPGFVHHAVAAKTTGVLALRLANADTLPMSYSDYAGEVLGYLDELTARQQDAPVVDLAPAVEAARAWQKATSALERAGERLTKPPAEAEDEDFRRINEAIIAQERDLTQQVGLPDRPWYKHMIYAPGLYTGYAAKFLPALQTAIDNNDAATARQYRDLLIRSLEQATEDARQAVSERR